MEGLQQLLGPAWPAVWTVAKIVAIVLPLMAAVAYLTLAERKVIGYMQVRIGPNRVGWYGILQPIADAIKLLTKEVIIPSGAKFQSRSVEPLAVTASAMARKSAGTSEKRGAAPRLCLSAVLK